MVAYNANVFTAWIICCLTLATRSFFQKVLFFLVVVVTMYFSWGGGGEGDVILRKKVLVRCEKQDAQATKETTAADLVFVFEREKSV